ncbi:MAG TPA: hypothetical protein VGN86_02700 [Pyrinomonadaceae bacterium]|jgi:hypothetical protein|nr:hypothetical protein [Pyrinomonadaceae bacterium]
MRSRFDNPLDNIRVASPCNMDWEQMIGNDRSRFCGQCNLNVYNLSGMSRAEAEHLISNNEGNLCLRYYRRADGSVLTQDCPVGLRAIKRRLSNIRRSIASAVLSFFAGLGIYEAMSIVTTRPQTHTMGTIASKDYLPPKEPAIMGGAPIPIRPARIGKMVYKKT